MRDFHPLAILLADAVRDSLASTDEPVGINVSGGLDSSSVACVAREGSFFVGPIFTGYYDLPGFDEREWSRLVPADERHEIEITAQDFIDNFDAMMRHFTPPFQGPGMFGQYMVAKYISEQTNVKVVLSGEGSDELFGGYARLLAVAGEKMPDGYEDYSVPLDYPTILYEALAYDYARLPQLLAVDDAALGAFGLEARAPFTDQRIVDYAMGLPPTRRIGKRKLKYAMDGIVPDGILKRTDKKGFPVPLVQWSQGPLKEFVSDRLGYVPDPAKPWDRAWWNALCTITYDAVAA